jgi:hypothetical protein
MIIVPVSIVVIPVGFETLTAVAIPPGMLPVGLETLTAVAVPPWMCYLLDLSHSQQ